MQTGSEITTRLPRCTYSVIGFRHLRALFLRSIAICILVATCSLIGLSQNKFEKHRIGTIVVSISGAANDAPLVEEYRLMILEAVGDSYSAPRIRDAIQTLYQTKKIDTVTVGASLNANGDVDLLFTVKRKTQASKVSIELGESIGDNITEQELMFKLNLLSPGTVITEQTLRNNADQILDYLRERGFYRSEVTYTRQQLQNENEVAVVFRVAPLEQTQVEEFTINIEGYNKPIPETSLKLKKGGPYSRDRLLSDVDKVREVLKKDNFLAPEIDEPRTTYDSDKNTISIALTGKVGPTVNVSVDSEKKKVGEGTQTKLLPIKREGTLDYAAIVEGERRLENYYQEQGYFFADVTPVCSAKPQLTDVENNVITNETDFLCKVLGGQELIDHEVNVDYKVDLNRKLRLVDIRVRGTDKLNIEDIRSVLGSQEANILGIIPLFGYGRGYTSATILEDDRSTIKSLMSELGYRDAEVNVSQGVSPNGEDLIITFIVDEGIPTVISDVKITGNKEIPTQVLQDEILGLRGAKYSRARIRNAAKKLSEYYSNLGYYNARVITSMTESPTASSPDRRDLTVEFKIEDEGKKLIISRILVNGNETTKAEAVLKAVTLRSGELLRSIDVYSSEQNLYASDAFSRVEIKPQFAGLTPEGNHLTDIIVSVEEQPMRLMTYGGGYSTDFGLSGFFDIRHVNLFGNLWQGGSRVKISQRQQLVQLDFVNPRFLRDGEKRFAPLTFTALYQRDSTVTRFFRSAFDQGTFGIVQRVDEEGNPIDEFGAPAGDPTINKAALFAETSRTLSRKNKSLLFFRYRFEDVRLFNIESLLVKDLLRPDERVRISGFGTTFVRDTRRDCSIKYTLLDLIAKGEPTRPCRYNGSVPTNGSYITVDYNISLPTLGANIGFQKFQATADYFYTLKPLRNTTFAARGIIGAGRVFANGDRFNSTDYPSLNGLLPISERFFAGGSTTLRGFDFEEAGPRVVVQPTGTFIDSNGNQVYLDPFTVPFGGNGMAIFNFEARIPLTTSIRVVPFYDGGNVYRKAGDIFKTPDALPNDVTAQNQRAVWTHTIGIGFRLKTPIGGEIGVDYGFLMNPPEFLIPQAAGGNAIYRLQQSHIHFRFSQAF